MTARKVIIAALSLGVASFSVPDQGVAQDDSRCWPDGYKIDHLKDDLYVIFGTGGNIGMSVGDEGIFLIDDQVAPLTDELVAEIAKVSDGEIRFVVNTHYHGDHMGGNENLGQRGAVIVAHDQLRARLASDGETPEGALPVITFNDQASIFLNGKEARAIHFPHAHTDGDSVVFFREQNVVHMGDVHFNSCYPFIDVEGGGSINGTIAAVDAVLGEIDDDTIVIPGHGPVTNKVTLAAYGNMLKTIRDRVAAMKEEGKSLEEVLVAAPSGEFDADWTWGFIGAERIVTSIYNSL